MYRAHMQVQGPQRQSLMGEYQTAATTHVEIIWEEGRVKGRERGKGRESP